MSVCFLKEEKWILSTDIDADSCHSLSAHSLCLHTPAVNLAKTLNSNDTVKRQRNTPSRNVPAVTTGFPLPT